MVRGFVLIDHSSAGLLFSCELSQESQWVATLNKLFAECTFYG